MADAVRVAKQAVAALAGERPAAARQALDDLGRWAERLRQGIDALVTAAVEGATAAEPLRWRPARRRAIGR